METTKKTILVPWDFSEGAENAILHAKQLANAADNDIMLLHIIPRSFFYKYFGNKNSAKEIDTARHKMEEAAIDIERKYGFRPQTLVLEGRLNHVIKDMVVDTNINLVVANKIYSYDKKPIESSNFLRHLYSPKFSVPFIITKSAPLHSHYIEIVVPLDHDKKYKEILHWIIYLSKYYKCNINLIKPFINDEGKKKDMANNIYFTKKMLDGSKIIYGIKTAKKKNTFKDEVFKFAENIDADLILIMADKYDNYISENKDGTSVPIMCINPRARKYQSFY
ncbi:MAG: universal stress protein [Bacteroidales bacterium]|nr:universal stress protein [Bacteroidales bacterium]MBN2748532.1 universal stress protein [Bacteroidales bacterium]